MIAIDLSGSNGNPNEITSHHFFDPQAYERKEYNKYEKTILSISSVIEFYDNNKHFPVFGFGACINDSEHVSNCFALNRNEDDPYVNGVQGIMDVYHSILNSKDVKFPDQLVLKISLSKQINNLY